MSNPTDIISGHTISFDHGIAIECGVNAAIIYNHIIFWLKVNKDKPDVQKEGKVWMYQTQEKMAEFFQFFDDREVKYCIKILIDKGLLVKKNFNKNHFDHTNWYTLPDAIYQKVFTKVQKCTNRSDKNAPIESPPGVPSDGTNLYPSSYIQEDNTKELLQEEVVVSLNSLDISDRLKLKISREYPVDVIDLAVKRCKRWKGRENDEVGIQSCLKWRNNWKDIESPTELKNKNLKFLIEISHLDGKKVNNYLCNIGPTYVEFSGGVSTTFTYSIDDKDFVANVKKILGDILEKGL